MAGGRTKPSPKVEPSHRMEVKINEVARGKGVPIGADGSGRNRPAKALESHGIKPGKQPHVKMVENSGHDSPVGKELPKHNGGPRKGQTGPGVDKKVDSFPQQGNDWRNKRGGSNMHGHEAGKGSTNRFDLYSQARK